MSMGMAFLLFIYAFFGTGIPLGAGFQPTPRKAINRIFQLCEPKGKVVYDLGAGFGRVLFEAASAGAALCVGVEADPIKCWWIRREAKRRGMQGIVSIIRANLLHIDLSKADIVFVFLSPALMKRLKQKVFNEMKPGSIVASYEHRFKGWEPETTDAKLNVYIYRVPLRNHLSY